VPKLKPTCQRKRKTAGIRGVSPVGGKVEELWGKGSVEKMSSSLEWKREGVMYDDNDDDDDDDDVVRRCEEYLNRFGQISSERVYYV